MKLTLPKIDISVQLIILFIVTLCFGDLLPLPLKSTLYAISITLKEILILVLPFVIFSCLLNSIVSNREEALSFIVIVLIFVCISNLISILAGYGFAQALPKVQLSTATQSATLTLVPLWSFKIPELSTNSNVYALVMGLVVGTFAILFRWDLIIQFGKTSSEIVTQGLKKLFVPVLPLFALGFIIKMQYEGILLQIVKGYLPIIITLILANLFYLAFMFGLAAKFNVKRWWIYLKNVIPAGILAFSTMSSLATMPLTLDAAEKNTEEPELARAIIPATVNIHMVGDSLVIPIIAIAIMISYGYSMPNLGQYLLFTQFFMLAKFAIPGIPSGTILVMLPILENCLGFTAEMSAFVTATYILFDPIATAGNVLGNSALVIMLTKIFNKVRNKTYIIKNKKVN